VYKAGELAPTLTGITATYTGTATIYLTTPIDSLKAGLTVKAQFSNGSEITVSANEYSLSGPLTAGTCTVTVTYQGQTATFNVTVTAPITNAEIEITAPVKGEAPDTTATGTGAFTIGTVTWSPSDNPFQGGVVYTATVTLTANAGHTFTGLNGAEINGETATVSNNTGAAVTLSHTFAETDTRTATALDITSQPTKLTYTHGEALDLTGLAVKLTFDDGTSDDVAAANFASHNITAAPSHGDHLVHSASNGQPVVIKYGSHLSQNTNNLTVNKASGAGVSAPTAATVTHNSVTLNTVTAPANEQTVEYSRSDANSTTTNGTWQTGTTFSGLTGGTQYYFFARAAGNANYNAGTASSVAVTTKQNAELTITFAQITDAAPSFTVPALSKSGTATAPLSVADPAQYTSIEWYIDGVLRRTGAAFTLNAANYSTGGHFITLEVVKNGLRYNTTITFTVAN